jgi:hypothetical protein
MPLTCPRLKPLKTPLQRFRAQPRERPLLPCLRRNRRNWAAFCGQVSTTNAIIHYKVDEERIVWVIHGLNYDMHDSIDNYTIVSSVSNFKSDHESEK